MSSKDSQDLFDLYLKNIEQFRRQETYKWDALVCFQENWDLDAPDLRDMIERACAKTGNLLAGAKWYPRDMLKIFAQENPDRTRAALRDLLDGSDELKSRLSKFESAMDTLLKEHNQLAASRGESLAKNHFQDPRSMSIYLGLAHPGRYYLYKASMYKSLAKSTGRAVVPNKFDRVVAYQRLCDKVLHVLKSSYPSIIATSDKLLTPQQRKADPEHHLLVQDIAHFCEEWESSKAGDTLPLTFGEQQEPEDSRELNDRLVAPYGRKDFLSNVYMSGDRYDELVALLKRKHNIILQGAPGTGKTYAARRLAWVMMGERDDSRVQMVQFHQSYSYEDFVIGYRPDGRGGFEAREGAFLSFCRKAAAEPDKKWFFLIDEINRGNVSRIFGEMLMLIEGDHRGDEASLALDGSTATVPANVYVVGMMNTADRSLALIDYALRRRFGFFDMVPAFDNPTFQKDLKSHGSEKIIRLAGAVEKLNGKIAKDPALGPGFEIGHSYFSLGSTEDGDAAARSIVEYDLAPTLREYWYDDNARADREIALLRDAIK